MGEAMTILNKDLRRKGMEAETQFSVIMPESYVCLPFMYTDSEERVEEKIENARRQIIHISRIVCWGCETGIKASGIPGMNCVHDIDISDCSIIHNKEAEEIDEATAKLTRIRVKRSKVRNFEYIQVK